MRYHVVQVFDLSRERAVASMGHSFGRNVRNDCMARPGLAFPQMMFVDFGPLRVVAQA